MEFTSASHPGMILLVIFAFFFGILCGFLLGRGNERQSRAMKKQREEIMSFKKRIAVLQGRLLRMF